MKIFNHKNLIIGLIAVAVLATAGFLLWEKGKNVKPVEVVEVDENGNAENNGEVQNGIGLQDNQEPIDTSDWQTKETSLFTISFPKDWHWIEDEENENIHVVTNNAEFDIAKVERGVVSYQDIGESDFVIGFQGVATSDNFPAEEFKPDIDYIKLAIEDGLEFLQDTYSRDVCRFIKDTKELDIAKCEYEDEGGILIKEYFIGNISSVIILRFHLGKKALVDDDLLDKIAENMILK